MTMVIDNKEYMTAAEAATLLSVDQSRVRQLLQANTFKDRLKIANRNLINADEVRRYAAGKSPKE